MSNIQPVSGMAFNKNDKEYFCCWGILHDTTAVLIGIAIEVLLALVGLGFSLKDGDINTYVIIQVVYLMIYCLLATCALVAIIKANNKLMWPIAIWTICFLGFLFLGVFFIIGCATINNFLITDNILIAQRNMQAFVCITVGVMTAWLVLQFWHLHVLLRCFHYLSDKKEANVTPTVMYHNGNTTGNQRVIQMK
uniref:Uncharacterized protein n=1 Tax=Plectus sambesii TaxID=2011161 RepID=A0A914V5P9_9BILA